MTLMEHTVDSPDISCRVAVSLLRHLQSLGYDVGSLTHGLPVSEQHLLDARKWVSWSVMRELEDRAASAAGNEAIMFDAGLASPTLDALRPEALRVLQMGSPKLAYRCVPQYASLFDRTTKFQTNEVEDGRATVTMSVANPRSFTKHACYYAQGVLAAIPTLWGLPPAEVRELECASQSVGDGAVPASSGHHRRCVYRISWQPRKPTWTTPGRPASAVLRPSAEATTKPEGDRHLRTKTDSRATPTTSQMAKLVDLALQLGRGGAVDDILERAVEAAREIPGVRFPMVLKPEATGAPVIIAPWPGAPDSALRVALKAIGLDFDEETGESPTEKRRVLNGDLLAVVREVMTKRLVTENRNLPDLLSEAWPQSTCDAVQRMTQVTRFVLAPVFVDGRPWATMLFFLDSEVPIAITEMVAAHLGLAVGGALKLDALQRHNAELAALNAVAATIADTLDPDEILDVALRQAVGLLGAESGAAYLREDSGRTLILRAHCGLSEEEVKSVRLISADDGLTGSFLESGDSIQTGDLLDQGPFFEDDSPRGKEGTRIASVNMKIGPGARPDGMLVLTRRGVDGFTDGELSLLIAVAGQVSAALHRAHLHAEVVESEASLDLVLESTAEGITVTDLEGNVVRANAAVARMHAWEGPGQLVGISSLSLIAEKDRPRAIECLKRTVETGSSGLLEYDFLRRDGTEFPAELNATLVKARPGTPARLVAVTRDVSDIRRAQRMLRDSETRYRLITESSSDIISMLTLDGRYKYNSPSLSRMGYTPADLLGKSCWDYIHPDDRTRLEEQLALHVAKGLTVLETLVRERYFEEINFRFLDSENRWHYVESSVCLCEGPDGEGPSLLLSSRDMSARRQAEDAIRDSEQKYRMIFDSANDIILLLDTEGRIVDANLKLEEMSGWKRQDMLGRSIHSLHGALPPDSQAIIAQNFARTMLHEQVAPYEVQMFNAEGRLATVEISDVAVLKSGTIVGDLAILRDVTRRHKKERELKRQKELVDSIMDATPNAVLVVSEDMMLVTANRQASRTLALGDGETQGRPVRDIEALSGVMGSICDVAEGRRDRVEIEVLCTVGGRQRTMAASTVRMDGNQVLVVLSDVTEDRVRQERLYHSHRQASVGEMAGGIAHELNNPLTGIIGLSELLLEEDLPASIREDLRAIHSQALRAAAIVAGLLGFARKHASARMPIQLNQVVEDVLGLRTYEMALHNITVKPSLDPHLPLVQADYFQMQQVVLNIILNAEQAMAEAHGQGTLTVRSRRVGSGVRLSFGDDGPGIPQPDLVRVFDPFFTTKEVGKGSGLGLSICHGIVTAHGGWIRARSDEQQGAEIVLELPAAAGSMAEV